MWVLVWMIVEPVRRTGSTASSCLLSPKKVLPQRRDFLVIGPRADVSERREDTTPTFDAHVLIENRIAVGYVGDLERPVVPLMVAGNVPLLRS